MKVIVLHDKYTNEPIIIRPDAISAIQKIKNGEEEYSTILVESVIFNIKETIGTVMTKIRKVESEDNE